MSIEVIVQSSQQSPQSRTKAKHRRRIVNGPNFAAELVRSTSGSVSGSVINIIINYKGWIM